MSSILQKMLPIRCFTCNKVLGQYNEILEKYKNTETANLIPFFEKYEIKRYCCRKVFLTHVDIQEYDAPFTLDNIVTKSVAEITKIVPTD